MDDVKPIKHVPPSAWPTCLLYLDYFDYIGQGYTPEAQHIADMLAGLVPMAPETAKWIEENMKPAPEKNEQEQKR